jgi:hypothetical protein
MWKLGHSFHIERKVKALDHKPPITEDCLCVLFIGIDLQNFSFGDGEFRVQISKCFCLVRMWQRVEKKYADGVRGQNGRRGIS